MMWYLRTALLTCATALLGIISAQAAEMMFTKPLDAIPHYRERPLFTPSRRPPDVPVPVEQNIEPVMSQPLNAVLLGVVSSTEGDGVAILRIEGQADTQRVRIGEAVNGWQLDRIEAHSAIFKSGEETTSLTFPEPEQTAPSAEEGVPESSPDGTIDLTPQ